MALGRTRRISRNQALSYELSPNRRGRRLHLRSRSRAYENPLGVTAISALMNGRRRPRRVARYVSNAPSSGYSRSYARGFERAFGQQPHHEYLRTGRLEPVRRPKKVAWSKPRKRKAAKRSSGYAKSYAKTRATLRAKPRSAAKRKTPPRGKGGKFVKRSVAKRKKIIRTTHKRAAPRRVTTRSQTMHRRKARPNRYKRGKLRGTKLTAWRKKHPGLAHAAAAARSYKSSHRKTSGKRKTARKNRRRYRRNPGAAAAPVVATNRRRRRRRPVAANRRRRRASSNLMYENRRRRRSRKNAASPNRRRRRRASTNLMYANRRRRSRKNAASPNRRRRRIHANRRRRHLRRNAAPVAANRRRRVHTNRRHHARRNILAFSNRRHRTHRFSENRRRRYRRNEGMLATIKKIAGIGFKIGVGFIAHRGLTWVVSEKLLAQSPTFTTGAVADWRKTIAGAIVAIPIVLVTKKFMSAATAEAIGGGAIASLIHMGIMAALTSAKQPVVAGALAAYPDAGGSAYHTMSGYGAYEMVQPLSAYEMVQPLNGLGNPFYQAAGGFGQPLVQGAGAYPQLSQGIVQAAGEYEMVNGVGDSEVVYDGVRPDLHSAERMLDVMEAAGGYDGFGDIPLVDMSQPRNYETGGLPAAPVEDEPAGSRAGVFAGGGGIFG